MRYTNIVHISDLHLKNDESGRFNQSVIIEGLKNDLRLIKDSQLRPDLIVFTGDIAQGGNSQSVYDDATNTLNDLADAAGLDHSRVFICPGNHDASRDVIDPAIPEIKKFRERMSTTESINKLATDSAFINHVGTAFKKFNAFQDKFGNKFKTGADALSTQYYIRDLNLAIISINTASLTGCGLSEDVNDLRNLIVPEITLVNALRKVPKGAQVIVLGHHPLNWLSEPVERLIQPILHRQVDMYLSGHLHDTLPLTINAPSGQAVFAQSGALYAARDWWNGYCVISTISGEPHIRMTYKKWHDQRRQFGVASELDDDGIVYNTPESRTFWSTVAPRMDLKSLDSWRVNVLKNYLNDEFGSEFLDICEQGRFVRPEFEKDNYVETEGNLEKSNTPETVTLQEAMSGQDNLIVVANNESGKTTLIRHWARELSLQSIDGAEWSIPVVVKYSELKTYLKGIENLIKQKLLDLPSGITSSHLLEDGRLTILIDDMQLKSSKVKDAFDALVSKYPTCRYVIFTGTIYLQGAGIAPVIVPGIPFSHLRLKQLRHSQLLSLIESHGTTDPAQADRLLQRMVQEASSLNVPITPVTGTFLIQIYTEDASQPLINRANLIERYVEISLEKFAPQELIPSTFDFHNKSDLLSFIAEHMCRYGSTELAEEQFVNLITEYMAEYGLRFSSIDIIDYFVKARVLTRHNQFISFRLNAFLEYFSACRMVDNSAFKDWVFENERYLNFSNEIAFYAAISRRDQEHLKIIFERFKDESSKAWKNMPEDMRNGSFIEKFILPSNKADEAEILDIGKRVFEGHISDEDRMIALDGDDMLPFQKQNTHRKASFVDPGERWLAQLTLLGEMLKNMDFIPTNFKKEVLKEVLQGWLQFTAMSMGIVPDLAKERRMTLAGIDYVVLFPELEIAELARRIFMYMPVSTAKMATYHLGTEKLRVQLEEGLGAEPETMSSGQQFIRASILSQLGVSDLDQIIKRVEPTFRDNGFLQSVFIRMLSEVVVRFRLPEGELKEIRSVVAESIASLEGKTGQRAAQRKGQIIESLSTRRMLLGPNKEK